jgi:hypothetical protein
VVNALLFRDNGTGARSHSRDASAPEACRPKPRILSPQRNEGRRSAGRRNCPVGPRHAADVAIHLRFGRRPRVQRDALASRRSTAALSEVSRPRLFDFRPGFLGRGSSRALPALSCPSPADAPRAPAVIPVDMMPEAARERFARPPAGTALTPPSGSHPECALRWARCFAFNPMWRRMSNAVAELGDVGPCKSLRQRVCCRETSDRNGFDTRCDRNRKTINLEKIRKPIRHHRA